MEHQEKAPEGNLTKLMEFVLLGFADVPHLQKFLFGLFLLIYIIILMGNGIIFLITKLDPGLQAPMYFFLGNFSLLEICLVPITILLCPHILSSFMKTNSFFFFMGIRSFIDKKNTMCLR